jgi:hypothetical protein
MVREWLIGGSRYGPSDENPGPLSSAWFSRKDGRLLPSSDPPCPTAARPSLRPLPASFSTTRVHAHGLDGKALAFLDPKGTIGRVSRRMTM